ncbi:hypothetical protein [Ralstonia pseudosolanacearum]|uniref:hypothetical protein n=1 Tax=Ralstonia pseudosolanacearum TaxID=1310165 RepID=UPI000A98817C|nr:hypothetical protein [Ralstonia pseudosolanacearum]
MTYHHAIRFFSVVVFATALAACGGKQQSSTPSAQFNQKLTDVARPVSSLPADIEEIQCWAEKPLLRPDRAFCNIFFRGRGPKDIGQQAIGWDIPVREPSRLDGAIGEEPRYLEPYRFDLALLAGTKFLFVAKNDSQGLSIEVAANQDRVPLSEAQKFIAAVLPVVSDEVSRQLKDARAAAPDAIRATWSSK